MEKDPRRRGPAFKKLLVGLSILFALVAFGRVFVVLFNVQPHVNIFGTRFGLLDYSQGIPVDASAGRAIANDGKRTYYAAGWSLVSLPRNPNNRKPTRHEGPPAWKTDSTFTHYKAYNVSGQIDSHVTVNGIVLNRAKFYIKTKYPGYKLYYTYPDILNNIVASYCFWLLAQFVSAIQTGGSFTKENRLRLQNVGLAVLALQAVYFIVEFMPPLISYLDVTTTTVPGYWSSFDFRAVPIKPFSLMWLFMGALILIIASAFKDGEMLQEEKDLTI